MSKLTKAMNLSTSWTMDLAIAIGLGALSAFLLALLPLWIVPIVGGYLPYAAAGAVTYLVLDRQRRLVRSPPANFG